MGWATRASFHEPPRSKEEETSSEIAMRAFHLLIAAAIAAPSIALAQVGPNPAANGSLDPTVGRGSDAATAPDDAAIGSGVRDGTVADPLPVTDTTEATTNATAADNSTNTAPMSAPAAQAKKGTAPTSESARKPR
jgi:hypothetical protein